MGRLSSNPEDVFVGSLLPLGFDYIYQFLACGLTSKPDLETRKRESERTVSLIQLLSSMYCMFVDSIAIIALPCWAVRGYM